VAAQQKVQRTESELQAGTPSPLRKVGGIGAESMDDDFVYDLYVVETATELLGEPMNVSKWEHSVRMANRMFRQ
jgi:hypothetical protein